MLSLRVAYVAGSTGASPSRKTIYKTLLVKNGAKKSDWHFANRFVRPVFSERWLRFALRFLKDQCLVAWTSKSHVGRELYSTGKRTGGLHHRLVHR